MTDPLPEPWSFPLRLFDAFGIEMEYMIVDRQTLDVMPVCDDLFCAAAGSAVSEFEPEGPDGPIAWSNELALHVVELKTSRPVHALDDLEPDFQRNVRRVNQLLEPMGARLLPTAMHPWMDPDRETRLWTHEYNEVYRAYDRIFGCRGHGWGNLQSTHINLPFGDEGEFGRLYAALRLILPLLPCLAASSPIMECGWSPVRCNRMEVYRNNARRVPMMAGLVVPEPVFTRRGFEQEVLGKLYDQLRPLDPEGILQHEFANARGAMARFDRGAIEVRVLDIQECPLADLAIAALITEVVRAVTSERWCSYEQQQRVETKALHAVLLDTIRDAEHTRLHDRGLLDAFGISSGPVWAADLWAKLYSELMPSHPVWSPTLERMLDRGTLSSAIGRHFSAPPSPVALRDVYRELADCLDRGVLFAG
jgi:gamma-glutamyl:cysteine ligase YbdK (ATP-grasp superfamily)